MLNKHMNKKYSPKTIHLTGQGLEKVLGSLEAKVMELVWEAEEVTVRSIKDTLARRSRELSFNSIMTIMNRLVDKNVLKKCGQSNVYTYCPTMPKDEFSRIVARDIISAVVKDPALFSAASFTELLGELDKETIKKLKQLLKKEPST